MPKQGIVSIGLNVDYDKALKQMVSDFNQALTQISNESKKTGYAVDMKTQIEAIKGEIKDLSSEFRSEFKKINDQQIDSSNFKKFETEVTERFENIEKKFASINTKIHSLKTQLGLLEGSDTASKMKAQFDDWRQSIVNTYQELSKVVDLVNANETKDITGVNVKDIQEQLKIYRSTLREIQKARTEKNKLSNVNDNLEIDETDKAQKALKEIAKTSGIKKISDDLDEAQDKIKQLFKDMRTQTKSLSALDTDSIDYTKAISQIAKLQAEAVKTAKAIENMDLFLGNYSKSYGGLKDSTYNYIDKVYGDLESEKDTSSFLYQIGEYISQAEKFIEQNKNVKDSVETVTTAINTFTIKNGAIQIPIEVAKDKEVLSEITKAIKSMQSYVDKHPVVAQVKLVLDSKSSGGYKTKGDIAKQLEDGQNEPVVNISKSIKKTYIQSVKEAEEAANKVINKIKSMFDSSPIKISIDDKAFAEDLSAMVSSSLGKIANDATGLNVNQELEKLVGNLKEVSSSLSGNENFKFGLDEASIERITAAIKDMADMIQRAFGVASNDDIAAQWTTIESKFKGVAGEEGKLLKGNKEHKVAIQELAVEYKKYLDMGGKNDLSNLTSHKQTIKNITAEYENLGKAAQEAAQKQEQAVKKPASTKISSEEKEAINAVSRENKKLETQAGKTGTALDNEGKSAQTAAGKFRKLAKEKGAAVVANRELAKAAKETADALEREAKARKSGAGKTNANAVDESVYNGNYLNWQYDIEKSLKDSGDYIDVYESKISRATDGTVKFTAVVETLDGELTKFKKFSANVNEAGEIFAPSVSVMKEGQAANFEKDLIKAERIREAIENLLAKGEEKEPIRLDRTELQLYSEEIQRILKDLEELSGISYVLDITSSGRLTITRKEIAESAAEAQNLTFFIDRIDDIFEETADGIVVSSSKIEAALESAFDGAKISTTFSGLDPTSLDQGELWRYLSAIEKAAHELENSDTKYSVSLGSDGVVHITKEVQKANGEIKIFKGEFKDLNDLIDVSTGSVKDLAAALRDGFNSGKVTTKTRNFIQEAQDAFDTFKNNDSGKSGFEHISDDLDKLEQKIKEIKDSDGLGKFNDELKELKERLKNISGAQDAFDKFVLKHEGNSNWGQVADDMREIEQRIAGINSQKGLDELKRDLYDIAAKLSSLGKDDKLGNLLGDPGRTFKDINEVRDNLKSLFANIGQINQNSVKLKGMDKLKVEFTDVDGKIKEMIISLDSLGNARGIERQVKELTKLEQTSQKIMRSIGGMVKMYISPQDFVRYFRVGLDKVKELDTAMTELRKVSDASSSDLAAYFDDAVVSAKELGSSVNDMISATADWSRNGYNLPDSKKLAEIAVVYKNVGDGIDIEAANSSLVSTLQGFQMEASEAQSIIDSFNEVSNNFSISSAGLGEALKRSAAAFNAANTDLNQSIALITAGNEIVQSPEKVGKHYANLYSNVLKIKVAISVKSQRWSRPSKDLTNVRNA